MTNQQPTKYGLSQYFTISVILLLFSCSSSSSPTPDAPEIQTHSCELIESIETYLDTQTKESWQYDSLGRQVADQTVRLHLNPQNVYQDTSLVENYYNYDGFLTSSKHRYSSSKLAKPSSYTFSYSYTNNRLSMVSGLGRVTTYSYDSYGNLTSCIDASIGSNGNTTTYLFNTGKQTDYYLTFLNGEIERSYFFENGLRTLIVTGENRTKLIYDSQKRVRRSEAYQFNQLVSYTDIVYKEGTHPDMLHFYPKGWPVEMKYTKFGWSENSGLIEHIIGYSLNTTSGQFYKDRDDITTYEMNSSGLPISSETRQQSFNLNGNPGKVYKISTHYSFQHCSN